MKHRRRPTAIDETRVGLSFIEVLFALVVARVLDPLANYTSIPRVGFSHLGVAFVLTVTSWIGYHNSGSRPRHIIRFANLPLWQFVIDVALVVVYWLCAVSAEGTGTDLGSGASACPESLLVAVSFVLYCFWDWLGYTIRKSDLYEKDEKAPPSKDVPARRHVTIAFAVVASLLASWVLISDPTSEATIFAIDFVLLGLILGFRCLKEAPWVTSDDAYSQGAPGAPRY